MTAPALVMVGMGSTDARVAQVAHSLRQGLQSMRPGLSVHCAFLDHCSPSTAQVVSQLIKQGITEVVLVPLQLTHAIDPDERVIGQSVKLRSLYPDDVIYTYWDYFRNAFPRNAGLRIDHLLLSPSLAPRLREAGVDRDVRGWEKASDHAPTWIVID